jgi:hypothetical protein
MLDNGIHNDKEFWTGLTWPAAPNLADYSVFEQYCTGRVLLLGSTKLLLPLCTEAWDLEPKYDNVKIKNKDWLSIDSHWDTVIIDGGLTILDQATCAQLISKVLAHCDRFVARSFLNPNWPTKYAHYFPRAEELTPQPTEHKINEIYTFYIWNNQQS